MDSATGSPRSEREIRNGIALSLDGVTCRRDLRLSGATLKGDVKFTQSELGRELRCVELSTFESIVIDCSETAVVSGEVVGNEGNIKYELTQATVGEIDIDDNASFDIFLFNETTFSGFDFGAYKKELSACDWKIHDSTKNNSPDELENLYLRAKNGANEVGETRASAEFFIKEMIFRRDSYRQRAFSDDNLIRKIKWSFRWLANATLQATCGFGERPFRPLIFSVGSVIAFAGIYASISAPIEYNQKFGYVIFSIEAFISLILGLPDTTNSILSFIIAVEGFIGGFMIALFVFTLTRSVSR